MASGTHDDRTETADDGRDRLPAQVVQPYLHVALDGLRPNDGGLRCSLAGVHAVRIARGSGGATHRVEDGRTVLRLERDDRQISRDHLRIERDGTRWLAVDSGSHNGTRVDGAPIEPHRPVTLDDGAVVVVGRTILLLRHGPPAPREPSVLHAGDAGRIHPSLATLRPALGRAFERLAKVTRELAPAVLLRGPTGSGKEVVARAIHDLLDRKGPFVAVNCGAIPDGLVEAELFGSRAGAFSGAENREGLVRAADGGTLFLDEVAELSTTAQASLLRALETKQVRAVGGTEAIDVDVATLSASHRDVETMMADGSLRRDFYARLAGFELHLPPLSERLEDLGLLVARILEAQPPVGFTAEAAEALARYAWPLNIRELKTAVETAAALRGEGTIALGDLPPALQRPDEPTEPARVASSRDERLRSQLVELLERHEGNVAAIARELGKHRRQIHRWLDRLGLRADDHRPH